MQVHLGVDRTAFHMQGSPGGIYAVFTEHELFSDWKEDEFRANARILQLGLVTWWSQKVQELREEAPNKGNACMDATVHHRTLLCQDGQGHAAKQLGLGTPLAQ